MTITRWMMNRRRMRLTCKIILWIQMSTIYVNCVIKYWAVRPVLKGIIGFVTRFLVNMLVHSAERDLWRKVIVLPMINYTLVTMCNVIFAYGFVREQVFGITWKETINPARYCLMARSRRRSEYIDHAVVKWSPFVCTGVPPGLLQFTLVGRGLNTIFVYISKKSVYRSRNQTVWN